MKNITDLFDFEVRHLDDGSIEILDLCDYPQDSKNCFYLHKLIYFLISFISLKSYFSNQS